MPTENAKSLSPLRLFFTPIGRISREPYWLSFALVWALMGIPFNIWLQSLDGAQGLDQVSLIDFIDSNPLLPLMLFAVQWIELCLVIKRLQDRGLSGFFALVIFVPMVNIIAIIVIGLLRGVKGPNRYGPFPNSRWIKK